MARLRDGRDIATVLKGRRSRAGRLSAVHVVDRVDGDAPVRVAVIASKKVGDAVRRNRAKRLLREAAARVAWRPDLDVVLIARAGCATSTMTVVRDEIDVLARRLDAVARTA